MHSTNKPSELVGELQESAAGPYRGTPLGVEAAWRPYGIDVQREAAAAEATMRATVPAPTY
jgi:hypothetical protein